LRFIITKKQFFIKKLLFREQDIEKVHRFAMFLLSKRDCITDLKAKRMKKLVFVFVVAIAVMSLASCGNKKADAEKAVTDSIVTTETAEIAVDTIAADTIVVTDTIVVAE
jgi:hypothetical protein